MNNLKVGDKLMCIRQDTWALDKGGAFTCKKGEIFTFAGEDSPDSSCINLKEAPNSFALFWRDHFELVKKKSVKDLSDEELLNKIIKSRKYYVELDKRDIAQYRCNKDGWKDYTDGRPVAVEYRLKPKKEFKSYECSLGTVRIDGDSLKIGCQLWEINCALTVLKEFVQNQVSNYTGGYVVNIKGLKWDGHILPWNEAEELYTKLKEYLK